MTAPDTSKYLLIGQIFFTDFSLQSYLNKLSVPNKEDMTRIMADKLIEEMGIGHLLEDKPCQRSSSVYSPTVDGWKNGIVNVKTIC